MPTISGVTQHTLESTQHMTQSAGEHELVSAPRGWMWGRGHTTAGRRNLPELPPSSSFGASQWNQQAKTQVMAFDSDQLGCVLERHTGCELAALKLEDLGLR